MLILFLYIFVLINLLGIYLFKYSVVNWWIKSSINLLTVKYKYLKTESAIELNVVYELGLTPK